MFNNSSSIYSDNISTDCCYSIDNRSNKSDWSISFENFENLKNEIFVEKKINKMIYLSFIINDELRFNSRYPYNSLMHKHSAYIESRLSRSPFVGAIEQSRQLSSIIPPYLAEIIQNYKANTDLLKLLFNRRRKIAYSLYISIAELDLFRSNVHMIISHYERKKRKFSTALSHKQLRKLMSKMIEHIYSTTRYPSITNRHEEGSNLTFLKILFDSAIQDCATKLTMIQELNSYINFEARFIRTHFIQSIV